MAGYLLAFKAGKSSERKGTLTTTTTTFFVTYSLLFYMLDTETTQFLYVFKYLASDRDGIWWFCILWEEICMKLWSITTQTEWNEHGPLTSSHFCLSLFLLLWDLLLWPFTVTHEKTALICDRAWWERLWVNLLKHVRETEISRDREKGEKMSWERRNIDCFC